jgi:tetratricopeptide repeat protein 30
MSLFIKDGEYTTSIYTMIKEARFPDAVRLLQYELHRNPDSRAALSLLGYSYYNTQEFGLAAECYGRLVELFPENVDYRLHHAQALYNAFLFPEAVAVLAQIGDPSAEKRVVKMEAAIKYREEDFQNARILVDQFDKTDSDAEVNIACLEFKEGKYEEALRRFNAATRLQVRTVTGNSGTCLRLRIPVESEQTGTT